MKILIVEDNEDSRNLLIKQLHAHGHEVTPTANGAEALEQALVQPPDIIVSDILMPRMDGYQLCHECKQNDKLKDIPFIFYTATYTREEDEKFALSLGADAFLAKPTEPDALVQKLSEIVEKAKSGALAAPEVVPLEPSLFLAEHDKRIFTKLEDKVVQLEAEIAQRKKVEEDLQESGKRYFDSVNLLPQTMFETDESSNLTFANRQGTLAFGYTLENVQKGLNVLEFFIPEDKDRAIEDMRRVLSGDKVGGSEYTALRKDGSTFSVLVYASAIIRENKPVGVRGVILDITERKEMEEKLRATRRRFIDLANFLPQSVWEMDDKGDFTFANREALQSHGYTLEGMTEPLNVAQMFIPEDRDRMKGNIQRILSRENIGGVEYTALRKDGSTFPVVIYGTPITYGDKTVGLRGITVDITERKLAEEKLKKTAEEWRTTFDSITDLVFICGKDFRLVRVNKAFADAVKTKPEELIGKPCYEIVHGTSEPVPSCPYKKTIKTKKPATAEFFEPHLGMYLEVSTSPVFDEKGEVVASVHLIRDISERKKMEERLIVTDRLASIGELSSGIAHELNNPLTSVIGFSELLLDKDVSDDVKEDLKVINREARRTAGVVRNLLTFARKHPQEKESVDINSIIEKVLELRTYEQKVSNIEVNTHFAPDLPEITANSFDLQQVFLNIIINAEHFMIEAHGRGVLTITTELVGDIIRASFADDGPGIAKENLGHVFDPFFTTKEVGKGTGLGLSICHGIITEHGGRIYAESEPGKGATFVVELPISK